MGGGGGEGGANVAQGMCLLWGYTCCLASFMSEQVCSTFCWGLSASPLGAPTGGSGADTSQVTVFNETC